MKLFSDILPTFLNKAGEWVENLEGLVSQSIKTVESQATARKLATQLQVVQKPKIEIPQPVSFFGKIAQKLGLTPTTKVMPLAEPGGPLEKVFEAQKKFREELPEKVVIPFAKALSKIPMIGGAFERLTLNKEQENTLKAINNIKYTPPNYTFTDVTKDVINLGLNWTINPLARLGLTGQEVFTGKKVGAGVGYGFEDVKTFPTDVIGSLPGIYEYNIKQGDSPITAGLRTGVTFGFDLLMGYGIASKFLPLTRLAARQLPDSLLYKFKSEAMPIDEALGSLYGNNITPRGTKFIQGLTNQERIAFRSLANSYKHAGGTLIEVLEKTPTKLGEFAEAKAGRVIPEARPQRQLPGEAIVGEPQPAFGLQIQPVKKVGGVPEVKIGDYVRMKPEFARGKKIEGEIIKRTIEARAGFPAILQIKSPTGELFEIGANKLEKIEPKVEYKVEYVEGVKRPSFIPKGYIDEQITKMAQELEKIGKDTAGLREDEIVNLYNQVIGEITPSIPLEPQLLAQEAIRIFRGTDTPMVIKTIDREGLSMTIDKSIAQKYAKARGLTGRVDELFISPNAKIIKGNDIPNEVRGLEEGSDFMGKAAIWARKKGYDVIDATGTGMAYVEQEMRILNPEVLFTKSQLTDFYNQAVKGVKVEVPIEPTVKKGFEWKERGFVTSVKEQFPEVKVAGQYVPRSTDRLAIKARNLVEEDIVAAENMARKGTDDDAVAVASELIKHYNEMKEFEKAGEIAHNIAVKLTEQGRAVQAASILGRLTPEGQLKFAAKEINRFNEKVIEKKGGILGLRKRIPDLTAEQSKHILDEAKIVQEMPDGVEKAMRFQKLQNYIQDLIPSTLYQKLIAVWKAGLLTGIKTTGLNTLSNLFHGVSEIIKDVPAAGVDSMISLFSKERTLAFTIRGIKGVGEGVGKGWRYLRTGFDERNIGIKLDWKRVNFGKSKFAKAIQTYEETVFHLMGAEDQPFYYGAKARSLYSQSIAQGMNKGLKGTELQKFVDNLVQNPTDDMLKYATIDAETAVFQNKTALGDIAKAIQRAPGGEIIVPFGRTPSAVATQIINYSPIGIIKTIVENIGKGRFDQRLFAQGIGRGIIGIAVMYIGYKLFEKGLLTLGRPKGEREQKLWELEGRKENSFYDPITKSWRSVQVLGPLGPTLLIGGYFKQGLDISGSPTEAIVTTLTGTVKSFTEQTFLRGMSTAIEAITDPERSFETFFTSMAGSTVPTIIADLARATDVVERKNKGPLERIKSRIPFLREELEPAITALGGEVPRYGGNPLESMIDPSRPSEIKDTPVVNELRRLWDAGYKVSPTLLGDKSGYDSLTPEQNTDLWERAGKITESKLNNLFQLADYKNLGDDEKAKLVEDFVDKSKLFARVEKVLQVTEGLGSQELLDKLSELKKSGLMTRQVFAEYQRLR